MTAHRKHEHHPRAWPQLASDSRPWPEKAANRVPRKSKSETRIKLPCGDPVDSLDIDEYRQSATQPEASSLSTDDASLRDALKALQTEEFARDTQDIFELHEISYLRNHNAVHRLSDALRGRSSDVVRASVEGFFDGLFCDLRDNHQFEHEHVAMAVLVALKDAHLSDADGLIAFFAESTAAEIARLSRVARWLRRES